jgi:hypothetical protein
MIGAPGRVGALWMTALIWRSVASSRITPADRDVHVGVGLRWQQSPQLCGRPVAHHRSLTARKRSRTRSGREGWRGRANEIDTSVEASPTTALQPPFDHSCRRPELEQLGAADHVVLAPCDLADLSLGGGHFTSTAAPSPS